MREKKSAGTNQPRGYPAVWLPSSTAAFCPHSSQLSIPSLCKGGFSLPSSPGWFFLPTDQTNTNFWRTVAPPLLVYSFSLGWGREFMPMLTRPNAYLTRQLESGNGRMGKLQGSVSSLESVWTGLLLSKRHGSRQLQGRELSRQGRQGLGVFSSHSPPYPTLTESAHPGTRPPQQQCTLITGLCNTPRVNETSYFINV